MIKPILLTNLRADFRNIARQPSQPLAVLCVGAWFLLGATGTAWAQLEDPQRATLIERAVEVYGCTVGPIIEPPEAGAESSLTADNAALDNDGVARANGNVRLEKGEQALEAPAVSYNRETSQTTASNGLRYYRPGINLEATSADVNIDKQTGTFQEARFALSTNGGRGSAQTVESLGAGRFELNLADYSTCPGPDEDKAWRLTAERIELDRTTGRGEAYDAVLRVLDLPVFYTPYINFPIDDRRHTGFLLPFFGTSDSSGFELAAPYYVNLAPDRDLTLVPRLLTDRGVQLGAQLRYLNPNSVGQAAVEYLPSDSEFGDDRALFQLQHQGRLSRNFALGIDYTKVSDDEYFEDLSGDLSRTSQSQLERSAELTFAATGVRFSALVQNFQTLEDDDDDDELFRVEPYEQLPSASLSLLSPDLGPNLISTSGPAAPIRAGLDAEFANFQRDESVDGQRYNLRPRLTWGTDRNSWYANSQASYRYTRYELDDTTTGIDQSQDRGIANFSAESGLRFQRLLGNGWLQTLEPRAFYLYNGFDDQSNLPLFDTGVPDLHFERLFADNRFVGNDRIGDANQVTLGLTSRFIDPADGRSVVKLDLGRIYSFDELDVRLPNRSPVGFGSRHSDIVGNAEYRPLPFLYGSLTMQYDPDDSRLNRGSVRGGYSDDEGRRLDLGYRYYRNYRPLETAQNTVATGAGFETLEQTDLLFQVPVAERLQLFGRWNYSIENSQSVETVAGLQYRPSCCWAVRGAWRRYLRNDGLNNGQNNNDEQFDTAFLLQIELTGLGRFGDDIESVLERDENNIDSGFNGFLYP